MIRGIFSRSGKRLLAGYPHAPGRGRIVMDKVRRAHLALRNACRLIGGGIFIAMRITGRGMQRLRARQFGELPHIGTVMVCSGKNMRKCKKVVDKKK